jgi:BirA family biotin operon repressor/biotin-[acetyl-CoA-carboxylase] ligase
MSINVKTHQWAESKNLKSFFYPEITSTNDVAKAEFEAIGENFALYLTDDQSKGRGRGDNIWENLPGGDNLLSTWCFRMDSPPQPILTPLLGLALYESLFVFDSSLPLRLKAPNDIYLENGKLSGFLVEMSQKGNETLVFIGLGMNIYKAPQVDIPTSDLITFCPGFEKDWEAFCKHLYNQFLIALDKSLQPEIGEDERDDLLEALNAGLPAAQHYKGVSAKCDLITVDGTISWMDL